MTYHVFENYGRTSSGVGCGRPIPRNSPSTRPPPSSTACTSFPTLSAANVTVYISPSHNYLGDGTPLQYGIALYPAGTNPPSPTIVRPVGDTIGANLPDGWGNAVGDGVWGTVGNYTKSKFKVAQEGAYTLRIWALLPSIIVQKIVVDLGGVRPSYLGPPESFLVGRDGGGVANQTSFADDTGTVGASIAGSQGSSNGGSGVGYGDVLASVIAAVSLALLGAIVM